MRCVETDRRGHSKSNRCGLIRQERVHRYTATVRRRVLHLLLLVAFAAANCPPWTGVERQAQSAYTNGGVEVAVSAPVAHPVSIGRLKHAAPTPVPPGHRTPSRVAEPRAAVTREITPDLAARLGEPDGSGPLASRPPPLG